MIVYGYCIDFTYDVVLKLQDLAKSFGVADMKSTAQQCSTELMQEKLGLWNHRNQYVQQQQQPLPAPVTAVPPVAVSQ